MRLELDHFHSELAVMMKVSTGAHPNVIRMVGCIPEVPYPAVVMEYAPLGNLHNFLLRYKNQVSTYHDRTMRACHAVSKLILKAYTHMSQYKTVHFICDAASPHHAPRHCGCVLCQSC